MPPPSPRTPGPGAAGGPALPLMRIKPPGALPQAPITPTDYLKLPLQQQQGYAAGGAVQKAPRIRPRSSVRDYAKKR
jgi:hypothetical protein